MQKNFKIRDFVKRNGTKSVESTLRAKFVFIQVQRVFSLQYVTILSKGDPLLLIRCLHSSNFKRHLKLSTTSLYTHAHIGSYDNAHVMLCYEWT